MTTFPVTFKPISGFKTRFGGATRLNEQVNPPESYWSATQVIPYKFRVITPLKPGHKELGYRLAPDMTVRTYVEECFAQACSAQLIQGQALQQISPQAFQIDQVCGQGRIMSPCDIAIQQAAWAGWDFLATQEKHFLKAMARESEGLPEAMRPGFMDHVLTLHEPEPLMQIYSALNQSIAQQIKRKAKTMLGRSIPTRAATDFQNFCQAFSLEAGQQFVNNLTQSIMQEALFLAQAAQKQLERENR